MKYQLIPTTFYIATDAGEKWYHQEAQDAGMHSHTAIKRNGVTGPLVKKEGFYQ